MVAVNEMKELIKRIIPPEKRRAILEFLNRFWVGFCSKLSVKDRVCFYTIRENGALLDNAGALYDALGCKKVIFAAKLPHSNLQKVKAYYLLMTSKVIVTDDYCRYMRVIKLKESQFLMQIWHGCGAFKKFALDAKTDISEEEDRKSHTQYGAVAVTSEYARKVFAGAFGIDEKICIATGLPKTDIIINNHEKLRDEFFAAHPSLNGKTIYLYCPTFREKDGQKCVYDPGIDFDALSGNLSSDEIFIISRHPLADYEFTKKDYPNIKDMTECSTLSLVSAASVVITDYSSVAHDATLCGTPMVFYCPDVTEYERGFYLKFPDDLPGEMTENPGELLSLIRQAKEKPPLDRIERFRLEQLGACDGKSTGRLADIIRAHL